MSGAGAWRRAAAAAAVLAIAAPDAGAEIRRVPAGSSLQAALNAAAPGDVVVLEAGAEFVGNFVLPVKSGNQPIVLRSAFSEGLPEDGQRIQPSHATLLARLRSPNTAAVLRTAAGAHDWELRYLEIGANLKGYGDILQIGDGSAAQDSLEKVPRRLLLRHLYVHGDALLGQKRCISLNAAEVTIADSHVSDCKGVGQDTQAIGGWNGPGPYVIENNYLEGAGENVLFGGADPAIPNLVADGIVFRRNHVARPVSWRQPIVDAPAAVAASGRAGGSLAAGTYTYSVVAYRPVGQATIGRSTASAAASATVQAGGAVEVTWQPVAGATEYRVFGRTSGDQSRYWSVTGTRFLDVGGAGTSGAVPTSRGTVWSVKNLFELKNARNVTVEANLFENHWRESQAGYAIVLTPRNSNGACTWCVVENVRFENNLLRNADAGINVLGYDLPSRPTRQTRGVIVRNNLFHGLGAFGGNGWFVLLGDEPRDVTIDHNTIAGTGDSVVYAYGGTSTDPREILGFTMTNNAARHGRYGIAGAYFPYGSGILAGFFPGSVVRGNYLAGGAASRYPEGNSFAGVFEDQFVNPGAGDFRLRSGSPLRGAASDGTDVGADVGRISAALAGVVSGAALPPPALTAPRRLRIVAF
jgi:hypothetical protein